MKQRVICIGEVLWDSLPLGLFPGGAPFNVALHLHSLGEEVAFVSRVGSDELGREIRRRMNQRRLTPEYVQTDETLPTGFVLVTSEPSEDPEYDILKPAAWDAIEFTDSLARLLARADYLVCGSLAQRESLSRATIQRCLSQELVTVFDVNLRPPYDAQSVVEFSLEKADFVKLNVQELTTFISWFNLNTDFRQAIISLVEQFGCRSVCVTRGAEGAILYHEKEWFNHPGYSVRPVDAVGAGDAFLAAMISRLFLQRTDAESALDFASRAGAFVATQYGATPELIPEEINLIAKKNSYSESS